MFMADLEGGGAERMMVSLAAGLEARGVRVDLLLADARGPYLSQLPKGMNVIDLASRGVLRAVPGLARYLRKARPQLLITTLHHSSLAALAARGLARTDVPLILRESNTPSQRARTPLRPKRWLTFELMRLLYSRCDGVIAVSRGVAADTERFYRLPPEKVEVLYNPVVTAEIDRLAQEEPGHPWLSGDGPPVILGIGRLQPQKDFSTLLRAFANVRSRRSAKLLILGEGPERDQLLELAAELGVADDVDLPGFVNNPFAYLSRASLFVLSSRWEGLPGVLIQALACGCPVVSTDCPSGPDEVLEGGRLGSLVNVGDSAGMAAAIERTMAAPPNPDLLKARSLDFSQSRVVEGYIEYFERQLMKRAAHRGEPSVMGTG